MTAYDPKDLKAFYSEVEMSRRDSDIKQALEVERRVKEARDRNQGVNMAWATYSLSSSSTKAEQPKTGLQNQWRIK